ncbi:MAG: MFS transporter [Spirosomataceae bacterium]
MLDLSHLRLFFTRKQTLAVGFAFFSIGFLFGSWATFIPFVKNKFGLDDAQLGLLLLSMPMGSLVANPVAAGLLQRFGMQKMTVFGMFYLGTCFVLPIQMPVIWATSLALFACGTSITTLNVAMNTTATSIELNQRISIMSTCHGMFSIGLMVGSLLASATIGFGVPQRITMLLFGGIILAGALLVQGQIRAIPDDAFGNEEAETTQGAKFVLPRGPLLIMILISLFINFSEGSMADWTAVYMKDIVVANAYFIGWGLAGYSFFMAAGRLLGDSLIPRWGRNNVLIYGGLLASAGLFLSIIFPYTWTSIAGFSMVGAGVSCGAPIMYGSAARVPGMAKGAGLATMNTFSMGGFLFGPVLVGFLSEAISLPFAFGVVGVMALIWAYLSKNVKLY